MTPKTKKRVDQLIEIGLIYNGQEFIKDDINVHWTELICESDESWDKLVFKIKAEMERRKDGI